MSQVFVNQVNRLPFLAQADSTGYTSVTLNAAGETVFAIGHILLQNPIGGSKTISAAGGGSIVWRTGTTTFANAATTFKVGIQDVAASSAPAQGDGTFDVEASFTGGGGGVTSAAVQTSVMTSGTKTIAHGDLIAVVFSMTARGGTDSVLVNFNNNGIYPATPNLPTSTNNTTGAYLKTSAALPNCYIVFNDGSIGYFGGFPFQAVAPTGVAINSGTATADEYGNIVNLNTTYMAYGLFFNGLLASTSSDFELILYSNPLETPVAERTITVDVSKIGSVAVAQIEVVFSVPFAMKANTNYAITCRPTTANNVTIYYLDALTTEAKLTMYGSSIYACRRLDNTGAFSDFNAGTAKTRTTLIGLLGVHMEQGVNMCSGQVGVF